MNYLREINTKTKIFLLGGIFCLGLAGFSAAAQTATTTNTSSVDALNAAKAERQKKLTELNKQIQGLTKQIADTRSKSASLKNELLIFDKEIASTELQIQARETQIDDTSLQIAELEKLIQQKINDIEENKNVLSLLLQQLYQFDSQYALQTTLGSGSLSDFLDQIQYNESVQEKIYQLLAKIEELKARLEKQQAELKVQLKQLEELKEQLEITRSSLKEQRDQRQVLLNQTRGLESNYQKLLAQSKQEETNLEKEVQDLDAAIRAKLGNKTIRVSKGILAWPMDGVLTQKYGNTGFTALGYNFHNGIDVAAPAGQPIYAAADGEVVYTDKSDQSFGNWAAVKHNLSTKNGSSQIVTLYAHMRSIKVTSGQKVSQGDLIGYEGNTGNTTKKLYGPERGYHIHFGVYDAEGFGVSNGKYENIYGPYKVPYGYTYNPLDFL